MKLLLFGLTLVFLLLTPGVLVYSFAQNSYDVNIPTGAANPEAPYFWQSEKDGSTTGIIEIFVGDTVVWKNADTTRHTVTSGSGPSNPDGLFDSGYFGPGKFFSHTFDEVGAYPYYCEPHPWMQGTVFVSAGYSIIPNVGKDVGDGSTIFDVEYNFNRILSTAVIDEEQKSITFDIVGDAKSDIHDLEILLPSELISGPFVILVDDQKISDFEHVSDEGGLNILFIPLDAHSKTLTIFGTSVVPEFGPMVLLILSISIVSVILISQKFRLNNF